MIDLIRQTVPLPVLWKVLFVLTEGPAAPAGPGLPGSPRAPAGPSGPRAP